MHYSPPHSRLVELCIPSLVYHNQPIQLPRPSSVFDSLVDSNPRLVQSRVLESLVFYLWSPFGFLSKLWIWNVFLFLDIFVDLNIFVDQVTSLDVIPVVCWATPATPTAYDEMKDLEAVDFRQTRDLLITFLVSLVTTLNVNPCPIFLEKLTKNPISSVESDGNPCRNNVLVSAEKEFWVSEAGPAERKSQISLFQFPPPYIILICLDVEN
jgi:hypothetical protein